jgi:2-keto-4-pentenoate hydratase/2-oxohepta-3-ene-1,7-dioic acid hydratase in catechol pathway
MIAAMRFLRLVHSDITYFARWVDEETARLWTAAPWQGGEETDRLVPLRPSALLTPVAPTKIVCIGRNYAAHAAELGNEVPTEPLFFLKPPSALLAPGQEIELPPESAQVEHEGELAIVVGRRLRRANEREAEDAIFGATCANDVTARDIQHREGKFTRAKGFDTFCPVGPWVESGFDAQDRAIEVHVNGERRQEGRTSQMVVAPAALLSHVSRTMTLEPGDLVLTGTPAGVGPLRAGDRVSVHIEGLGRMENRVGTGV